MSDYISRQAAIEAIMRSIELDNAYELKLQQIKDIHAIPAADVVEVVRCKNCRYYNDGSCESYDMWRQLYGETTEVESINRYPDDYCNYGEKAEDEQIH